MLTLRTKILIQFISLLLFQVRLARKLGEMMEEESARKFLTNLSKN